MVSPRLSERVEALTSPSSFVAELDGLLEAGKSAQEADNFDSDRWPPGLGDANAHAALLRRQILDELTANSAAYARARDLLADRASREWFLILLAYRVLGHRHIRLPSNNSTHWDVRARAKATPAEPSKFSGAFGPLGSYAIEFENTSVALDCWWINVAWTFLFRQYFYARESVSIAPAPGDRVIDAGACFGDTALAFGARVGPEGRVISFEVDPGNAMVARYNLGRNAALSARINLRECALAHAEIPLYLHGSGPGAKVGSEPSAHRLEVTTIDRLVESGEIDRVDFIKMDVEGAERNVLAGAECSLRRFRPELAISVYHRADDLWRIPCWLESLNLGYRFYLDHYTIHAEETVLYARSEA